MTTTTTGDNGSLRDALYALSLAQPAPDAAMLDDLIRQYPAYATELTDVAIELALDALAGDDDVAPEAGAETDAEVLRAMSRFHNRLHTVKNERASAAQGTAEPPNPFSALNRSALRSLGARLNANTVFVLKLRDRQIDAVTMTSGFTRRVADEMSVPLDILAAHFAGRTLLAAHANYKADQKPEAAAKQTFTEAVQTSGLTPEQQSYLMGL